MRSHAELIVRDTRLFGGFDLYCNPHERLCDPTVHYIPSVLATHGQDDEVNCDACQPRVRCRVSDGLLWQFDDGLLGRR